MIKSICIAVIFCIASTVARSQHVANIRSFEEDGKIVVMYDLLSISPSKLFYIKLYCSEDGGKSFGSMISTATGDVNSLVKKGFNYQIVWQPPASLLSKEAELIFKVDASLLSATSTYPKNEFKGVSIQVLDVSRTGEDVHVLMTINNSGAELKSAVQVILSNFLIIDDKDKLYRDFDGDANRMISVAPSEEKIASLVIKNVSPSTKSFMQLEFGASGINTRLRNVPIANN